MAFTSIVSLLSINLGLKYIEILKWICKAIILLRMYPKEIMLYELNLRMYCKFMRCLQQCYLKQWGKKIMLYHLRKRCSYHFTLLTTESNINFIALLTIKGKTSMTVRLFNYKAMRRKKLDFPSSLFSSFSFFSHS